MRLDKHGYYSAKQHEQLIRYGWPINVHRFADGQERITTQINSPPGWNDMQDLGEIVAWVKMMPASSVPIQMG